MDAAAQMESCGRLFLADSVGFIKEFSVSSSADPELVSRWSDAGPGRGVVCCSHTATLNGQTVLAVARESGTTEVIDCGSGECLLSISGNSSLDSTSDPFSTCALLAWQHDSTDAGITLLSVTKGGIVSTRELRQDGKAGDDKTAQNIWTQTELKSFSVFGAGAKGESGAEDVEEQGAPVLKVDPKRPFVECAELGPNSLLAVGGKGLEPCTWNIDNAKCVWRAKNPKPNALGLVEEKWVTSLCHVSRRSPSLIAVGTSSGTVHLFDTSAQRRPVATWTAGPSPVKILRPLPGGSDDASVVFGTGDGMLGVANIRAGDLLGKFKGCTGGAVKAIACHSQLPLLASCGLDRYLHVHNTSTRALLGKVYVKQAATALAFLDESSAANGGGDDISGDDSSVLGNNEAADARQQDRPKAKPSKKKRKLAQARQAAPVEA